MTPTREEEFAQQEAQLDDLYREVIIDHYRNPRHRGSLPAPTVSREGYNPLCGDEIVLELVVDGDLIQNVAIRGGGCSISQASASMMAEAIVGKKLEDVEALFENFTAMMKGSDEVDAESLGDLEALIGVRKFPVRVKCATLAWHTLHEALEAVSQGSG